MYHFLFVQLASFVSHIQGINPAYLDVVKIFVGSIAWVGGLTFFMWWREKHKNTEVRA
jgi:hypothetical protein